MVFSETTCNRKQYLTPPSSELIKTLNRANGKIRRGNTFNPDEVDEYWALLLEKAFAKLAGGYMKLEGGFPRCALTFLTGGISTSDMIDSEELRKEVIF